MDDQGEPSPLLILQASELGEKHWYFWATHSRIQAIRESARGYRNREHFKTAIWVPLGGLQLYYSVTPGTGRLTENPDAPLSYERVPWRRWHPGENMTAQRSAPNAVPDPGPPGKVASSGPKRTGVKRNGLKDRVADDGDDRPKEDTSLREIVNSIGRKLRALRAQRGMSLQQLADRSDSSAAAIHKIERNGMVPTITTLLKLAWALNRPVSYFVDDGGGSTRSPGDLVHQGTERRSVYTSHQSIQLAGISDRTVASSSPLL